MQAPSASYSLTVRLEIVNKPGMLGRVTSAIGKAGGDIGAIDLVVVGKSTITRDITFKARDEPHGQQVVDAIRAVQGVKVVNVSDRTFLMHLGGKIEVRGKMSVKTRDDLSMAYTPGVARVCMAIHHDRSEEHTSELQSRQYLVCRLLLEKKKVLPLESIECTDGRRGLFQSTQSLRLYKIVSISQRIHSRRAACSKTVGLGVVGVVSIVTV